MPTDRPSATPHAAPDEPRAEVGDTVAPRWLDDTEQRAWRGLVAFVTVGLPRIERTFRAHGLVHLEYGILAVLSEHEGGLRLNALADVLGVSASRLTHRMAKLVERDLVVQRPCPEDGRGSVAAVTAAGRDLLHGVAPDHVEDVRATVFDHLDAEEAAGLADAMSAVAAGLGAGLAAAVARDPDADGDRGAVARRPDTDRDTDRDADGDDADQHADAQETAPWASPA